MQTGTIIRLEFTEVSLRFSEGDATRWTLGPDWYDDHQFDEDIVPYYEGTFTSALTVDPTPSASVKAWATQMIANTTDYRVKDWNGTVPSLTLEQHILTIWVNSSCETYSVPASDAQTAYNLLIKHPDGVIALPRHDGSITYTPVRSISRLNSKVIQSPVEN